MEMSCDSQLRMISAGKLQIPTDFSQKNYQANFNNSVAMATVHVEFQLPTVYRFSTAKGATWL